MIAIVGMLFKAVTGSFMGRAIAIAVAAVAALGVNNLIVASKTKTKIVQAAHKEGARRNAKARKIRNNIDVNSAMQRLRREYAGPR